MVIMQQYQKMSLLFLVALVVGHTMALSENTLELTKELSKFSTNLYHKCAESTEENIIVSPYSIASAVAFLSQGTNGKTFDEVVTALHIPSNKTAVADLFHELTTNFETSKYEKSPKLSIANRIYVQQGSKISTTFKDVATTKFGADAEVVNFSEKVDTASKINRWVENKTHDKIKDLVKPEILTSDTRLVLVNAIYFKGFWQRAFLKSQTATGKFYLNEQDTVDVEYMNVREGFEYAALDDLDAIALKISYFASNVYFMVILPNKRDGLSELENKMKDYDVTKITEELESVLIDLTLPKFKIEFEIKLNDVLKKMGITEMFSNSADLSGLLDSDTSLVVSDVIHKAFIEVNEEGTEAAAASFIRIMKKSGRSYSRELTLKVDHPFLFSVYKDDTALFTGRVKKFARN